MNRFKTEDKNMVTTAQGRMLGGIRQPFCGKCCGYHGKKATNWYKRAEKRRDRQRFRADVANGVYS
jgi:hypothetical protein